MSTPTTLRDAVQQAVQRLGDVLQSVDLDTLHEDASIGIQDALATLQTGLAAGDPVKAQLLAACEGLLRTGLKGGADYRLICIGMSGRELQPEDDAKAERIEEAVCAARAAVTAARGEVSRG